MVKTPIAELWAQAVGKVAAQIENVKFQIPARVAVSPAALSDRDADTLNNALGILEAHGVFLDMLTAEKNNRMAMKPRDFRVEFTAFYLQSRAINRRRKS